MGALVPGASTAHSEKHAKLDGSVETANIIDQASREQQAVSTAEAILEVGHELRADLVQNDRGGWGGTSGVQYLNVDVHLSGDEKYLPPPGYNEQLHHHRTFINSVKSRKPVVEDATFGFRAAGPALLSNISYFEERTVSWDPAAMKIKA